MSSSTDTEQTPFLDSMLRSSLIGNIVIVEEQRNTYYKLLKEIIENASPIINSDFVDLPRTLLDKIKNKI